MAVDCVAVNTQGVGMVATGRHENSRGCTRALLAMDATFSVTSVCSAVIVNTARYFSLYLSFLCSYPIAAKRLRLAPGGITFIPP